MGKFLIGLIVSCFFTLTGCEDIPTSDGEEKITSEGEIINCTASLEAGIRVEVLDKETGYPISCGATATISEGDYIEVIENELNENCFNTQMLSGAFEREGIYSINVIKEGYSDWYNENVEVSSNVCHVNTITVQAYLEK